MNLLAEYLKAQPDTNTAVQQYAARMMEKYPPLTAGPDEQVYEFRWALRYFPNKSFAVLIMIFVFIVALFGVHSTPGHREMSFSTYHLLKRRDRWNLHLINFFKKIVTVPIVVIQVVSGMMLVLLASAPLVIFFSPPPPHVAVPDSPVPIFVPFLVILTPIAGLFGGAKVLAYLKSLVLPPGSGDDFRHHIISLDFVSVSAHYSRDRG